LLIGILTPARGLTWTVSIASLIGLAVLGAIGARTGGAGVLKPTLRVTFWGAIAMAASAAIGTLVGHAI
jgi:VIT1/CCC1 family predicted Fe2+/Mn2+ transporter